MKQIFEANGFTSSTPIYCDHDPDQIAQLRRLGMRNCLPARKGQGSINAGIIRLKEFKVFYTSNSLNLHEERQKYMWAKDNKTGQSTNTPIDTFNHLMDSIRYGVYTHYFKK
jgi:phage terminase large subunit